MKALVDTNIFIDALRDRRPFSESAQLMLALAALGELELWMSPAQFGDLTYVLTEGGKRSLAADVTLELRRLRKYVHVCSLGADEVDRALQLGWADLEDALVYEAAASLRADVIVSRNAKDFCGDPNRRIPVLDAATFFAWYEERTGVDYCDIAW
ncbi:PIN domain-containing protein [Denitrobacterium detoxificans]|jgi:predicted nucleic acid-binding protein|uniref:type II toxin-antitoxin system VapC family toxin n=1 Tax=Denitrobacterium detoxificans TaxID=79604 RepID=UPI0026EFE4D2|nr:PIN domain-containing protein [Denitrobacterium detoxificans]MBE6466003.1 PIN domain-containing protein [Denitrobacterium detoxificans]